MAIEDRKLKEKQDRHNAILSAAEKIMQREGLYGLNMDLVAKEAELAKGTLYLYFKSKEKILATLSLKARKMLLEEFIMAIKGIHNPIDQIKSIVRANFTFNLKNPLYYELVSLYEINNRFTETPELQASSMEISQLIIQITEKAQADKLIHPSLDPIKFSINLWGMTVGIMQLIKVRGDKIRQYQGISEEEILESFINLMVEGIKI